MLSLIKRDIVVSIETFELTFAFDQEVSMYRTHVLPYGVARNTKKENRNADPWS